MEVDFISNVTTNRHSDLNILPSVKNIICIASGKGGVGKSTVSVNLALALAKAGASVGLIDADIHGPSIPQMLGITGQRPDLREIKGKNYILPIERMGIKVISIGLLVDERQAIVWRGPMVTNALRQFMTDCLWGSLDYLLLDLPPGTGDVHLTLVQSVPVTGAVIVTTPQEVALLDARKAIGMFRMDKVNVPIVGVVENMSYFSPPDLPEKKYHIFGKDGGKKLADSYEIPFLGEVPIVESIRSGGDEGLPAVLNPDLADVGAAYEQIASNAAQSISLRNANFAPSKIVEVTRY